MKSHYIDLSNKAYQSNTYMFTEFLSLSEQEDLYAEAKEFSQIPFNMNGGYEMAERKVCRFGNEDFFGYDVEFPIVCIRIWPRSKKFASPVSHRDYLGALMNLGLERKCFGDIVVEGQEAYVFVLEKNADFVLQELSSIGRNPIFCEKVSYNIQALNTDGESKHLLTASLRADAVIAKVFNISRNDAAKLFFEKRIAVNGRLVENNDKQLTIKDAVSVRGMGKFIIEEVGGMSKKGKQNIDVIIYK